jgi:large subunit ribosomal protein L30
MSGKLKVTQVRSSIGRTEKQKRTLLGLGLRKLNKPVVLKDTIEIRGMIRKVQHLVRVEPAE